MNRPSVSVVIPAYNASATIARAVDSCLSQTVRPFEVIVIDDGSTDDLAAVLKSYGSDVKLIHQQNARTAAARNRGLESAQGEFVAFLDADDYWEPEKLQRQLDVIDEHPSVSVVSGRFYSEFPGEERCLLPLRSSRRYDRPMTPRGSEAFMVGTLIWTGMVLVRRSAIGEQRFVSGLEPAEDRDFWIRLAADNDVYLMSDPLATAVEIPNSLSRSSIAVDCGRMLEVVQRHRAILSPAARFYWKAYVYYRWASMESSPAAALPMLLRSFIGWPFPLTAMPAMKRLGRIKRFVVLMRQLLQSVLVQSRVSS
ncbi:glycosyltransferase family 2 protein [Stieleria sp. JC731]|uniref:glycosyltransferase family 2 protein n=1 Tax=Pirellulaceae TaxID=2691357 RepID=UPI001E501576|nr:glycosyltransferase family 2 protein [Stieleria sp. JC731]MCC9599513.1 glycosyltransferase family 2 protein [Stieleria sp. JC731]